MRLKAINLSIRISSCGFNLTRGSRASRFGDANRLIADPNARDVRVEIKRPYFFPRNTPSVKLVPKWIIIRWDVIPSSTNDVRRDSLRGVSKVHRIIEKYTRSDSRDIRVIRTVDVSHLPADQVERIVRSGWDGRLTQVLKLTRSFLGRWSGHKEANYVHDQARGYRTLQHRPEDWSDKNCPRSRLRKPEPARTYRRHRGEHQRFTRLHHPRCY